MYLLAHLMEAFLWCRYYILFPYSSVLFRTRPSLVPRWLGPAVFLQPAMLEGQLIDLIIDDSRAQKVLGCVPSTLWHKCSIINPSDARYRPQWDVAQCIRYSVDEIQSGNVPADHGLKVY